MLIATYECLFDRRSFFQCFEKILISEAEVSEVVVVWAANVPLAKFKVRSICVDLIFADFLTPPNSLVVNLDYFTQLTNICPSNTKSLECINSLLSMQELKRIIE